MTTNVRGLHLHVDCASGAAGDMMLGALIDLGVPVDVIGAALDAIGAGRHRLQITRVMKHGIASVDLKVDTTGELPGVGRHEHPPHTAAPASVPPPLPPRLPGVQPIFDDASDASETTEMGQAPRPDNERTMSLRIEDLEALVERSAEHDHRAHPHARPRLRVHGRPPSAPAHDHEHEHAEHDPAGERTVTRAHQDPETKHDHVHGPHSPAFAGSLHLGPGKPHAHYHYGDIRRRIDEAPLGDGTKRRALDIFDRIARAEARLHGTSLEDVALHEVGAIDSVVDIVGTAAALDWLAPSSVSCASVAMGHGELHCAHGVLPIPAPAALEVLRDAGGVIADGGVARELCTPTGAAILASTVTSWTAAPVGRPIAVGWGAGDADLADRANVLRVVVLAPVATPADAVWQIEANLDDMSPELCSPAADAVFAAGALDVWWSPITMKKGRPALAFGALVPEPARDAVIAAILRETTTIGVRYARVERTVLARHTVEVTTRYGSIPVKVAADGDTVVNAAPEYEACAAAARQHGVPVKLVFAAALAAFDRG
ncbi:MAG: LarC family nickel insertion protein [Deltaproteobacteria bacterium]|nr:LarC family nickel insertion protein [Deltaproteobacteria bacterium]MDQ3299127.1 LarC family nickel insertion protein [Myxococcota bacterium]